MILTDYIILGIDSLFIPLLASFIGKPAKDNKLKYLLISLIYFACFVVLEFAIKDYTYSNVESYISMLVIIVSYMLVFRRNFFESSFHFLFGFFIIAFFEIIMLLVLIPVGMGLEQLVESPIKLIIFECFKLIFVLILCTVKGFRRFASKFSHLAPYIITAILNLFIVLQLMRSITDQLANGRIISYEYIYMLYIVMFVLNVFLVKHAVKSEKERSQIREYNKYEKMIIPLIENSRALEHDFKNHLLTLKGLAENENSDEFNDYLNSVNEEIKVNSVYKICNNPVMGALMQEKSNYARSNQIEFDIDIYENQSSSNNVKPYHMITVLSNLIDNAFEEVSKILDGTRQVSLDYKEKDRIEISVQNTLAAGTNEEVESIGKRQRYSSKGKTRGYGLGNIKKIAKEYNGELMVLHNKDSIEIKVILNPQPAK